MKLRYSVVAVAVACSLSSQGWADEAAAKKWIDSEFQPSTLSKTQQAAEMKWFIDAAKKLQAKGVKEIRDFNPKDPKKTHDLLKMFMKAAEFQFGSGQKNAVPFMFANYGFWHGGPVLGRTGQQMRGQQVTTYWNIDYRTWDFPTQQPAKIPNRKGILTHPAWLIAHSQNLESDPIHRGKWVQEKLLAGSIPDVPITVDAVIDPADTRQWLVAGLQSGRVAPAAGPLSIDTW